MVMTAGCGFVDVIDGVLDLRKPRMCKTTGTLVVVFFENESSPGTQISNITYSARDSVCVKDTTSALCAAQWSRET